MFCIGLFVCLFLCFSLCQYDYLTLLVKANLRHTILYHLIWGWHFCCGGDCFSPLVLCFTLWCRLSYASMYLATASESVFISRDNNKL